MLEHSSPGNWTERQFAFGFGESILKGPDNFFSTVEIFYVCKLLFSVNPASLKVCFLRNFTNSIIEPVIKDSSLYICLCLSFLMLL